MKRIFLNKILVFLITVSPITLSFAADPFAELDQELAIKEAKESGAYEPTFDHLDKLVFQDGDSNNVAIKNRSLIAKASMANKMDLVYKTCGPSASSSKATSSGNGVYLISCGGRAPVTRSLPDGLFEKEEALRAGVAKLSETYSSRSASGSDNYVSNGMISAKQIFEQAPSASISVSTAANDVGNGTIVIPEKTAVIPAPVIEAQPEVVVKPVVSAPAAVVPEPVIPAAPIAKPNPIVSDVAEAATVPILDEVPIVIAEPIIPAIDKSTLIIEPPKLTANKDELLKQLCTDAVSRRITRKYEKCMESVKGDYREVPGIQKKIALYDLEEEYDKKMEDELAQKCNQFGRRTKARKSCRANVRKDLNAEEDEAERSIIARYNIIDRKMVGIDEAIDKELKSLVKESCGKVPRSHEYDEFRDYSTKKRAYNSCKKPVEDKFIASKDGETKRKIEGVDTTDEEIAQVLKECGERPLIFGVSKYEKCVDKISLDNANRAIAQAEEDAAKQEAAAALAAQEAEGLAQSQLNCEDELKTQILSLLKEDKENILGKQFQKTSLKLALKLISNRSNQNIRTMEDFIKRDQQKLISSDNQKVIAKMMKFYKEHGKVEDVNFIKNQFSNIKDASYWNKEKRLSNETMSAYLLAESINNEKSTFSEIDAATAWFSHQANSVFDKGTSESNLTNMSALAYRQVELLKRDLPLKQKKLEEVITNIDGELNVALASMRDKVVKNLSQCIQNGVFNGSECWSQETFDKGLAQTIMGLNAQIINDKDFQISMDNKLKGQISGKFKFDFYPR